MPPTDYPPALSQAEQGADVWADVVRLQRWATPNHADFSALAGEMVLTLYAIQDLAAVLVRQVTGYDSGRSLYDDSRSVDPRARLDEAVRQLRLVQHGLAAVDTALNGFWSAIGHIGVEAAQ